jgi:hypothetical protein
MTDIVVEKLATMTVPSTDRFAMDHHNGSRAAIDGMAAWHKFGAETNLRSWLPIAQIDRSNARKSPVIFRVRLPVRRASSARRMTLLIALTGRLEFSGA